MNIALPGGKNDGRYPRPLVARALRLYSPTTDERAVRAAQDDLDGVVDSFNPRPVIVIGGRLRLGAGRRRRGSHQGRKPKRHFAGSGTCRGPIDRHRSSAIRSDGARRCRSHQRDRRP